MSRLRLNIHRIKTVAGIFQQLKSWMPYVQSWENPVHSSLVIAGISSAAFYPNVVIPMAMLYIVVRWVWCGGCVQHYIMGIHIQTHTHTGVCIVHA